MPKFDANDYLPVPKYEDALAALNGIAGSLLFEMALSLETRDIIIRNFIARADTMARSIFRLWENQDYQDCWILHRCLLDRLFHLTHLNRTNTFESFEAWSFLEQWNANNRVRSEPEFEQSRESNMFQADPEQNRRASGLSANLPQWQRPKAEQAAKDLNLTMLYRFGYDYASMHVHPMANDGYQDFYTITKLKPAPTFPDQRSVLSNTLLVVTLVVQEGLNASTLKWRRLVFDFLDQLRDSLDAGADDYKLTFLKLGQLLKQGIGLGQMGESDSGPG